MSVLSQRFAGEVNAMNQLAEVLCATEARLP